MYKISFSWQKIKLFFHLTQRNRLQLFYPLDSRNTKKQKTEMLILYKQQSYFSQIVSNKAKITTLFFYEKIR